MRDALGECSMTSTENKRQISRFRRIAPWIVLALASAAALAVKLDAGSAPTLLAGPMIHMPEADRYVISWAWTPAARGWVSLKRPDGASETIEARVVSGRWHVDLNHIEAAGTYTYTLHYEGLLGRPAVMAGPFEFRGPPPTGGAHRFIVLGDSGNGSNTQAALAELMHRQSPDLLIHVGDLIYPAGATADYAPNFYEPNAALIRSIPFMPCLGNHDVATERGAPMLREFVLPKNGPPGIETGRNYWFDFGCVRFAALDTNLKQAGGDITHEQMKSVVAPWLREALEKCDSAWKVVYFHHPFYTGSSHSAEGGAYVKEAYLDVLESCGVDVVFWGHNHLYERIGPMWKDQLLAETSPERGILYITTGAGGVSRYPERDPRPEYVRAFNDEVFSFTVVHADAARLDIRQIGETGETIDQVVLTKPRGAAGQSSASAENPVRSMRSASRAPVAATTFRARSW